MSIPETKAGKTTSTKLPTKVLELLKTPHALLTIHFRLRKSTAWAKAGHEVAWLQHSSSTETGIVQRSLPPSSKLEIHKTKSTCTIKSAEFSFTFDQSRGTLKSWVHNTTALLSSQGPDSPALNLGFSRPPTDNDRPADFPDWQRYGIDDLSSQLRSISTRRVSDTEVEVVSKTFISPPILAWGFDVTTTYNIQGDGSLRVKVKSIPVGGNKLPKYLPRVGLDLRATLGLKNASWYGLGPGETYPDTKASQKIGIYESPISDLDVNYEIPQESGNRMETNWLKLSPRNGGYGIRASRVGSEKFSWQLGRYKDSVVEKARHPCDLIGQEEDALLWRLDVAVAGVGTAACGPGVREEYSVKVEEREFEFLLEALLE